MIELYDDKYYMRRAIDEAKIALQKEEVPIGAVIAVSYTHLRAHET